MRSTKIRQPTPDPSQEGNLLLHEERLIPLLGGVGFFKLWHLFKHMLQQG